MPAFAVARLIYAGQWDAVQEACECDVISTALLLARWRQLHDDRADAGVVEDRILRQVVELRAGRGYTAALGARRQARFAKAFSDAANDAAALYPWAEEDAAQDLPVARRTPSRPDYIVSTDTCQDQPTR